MLGSKFWKKLNINLSKKRQYFRKIFQPKYFLIITLVPDIAHSENSFIITGFIARGPKFWLLLLFAKNWTTIENGQMAKIRPTWSPPCTEALPKSIYFCTHCSDCVIMTNVIKQLALQFFRQSADPAITICRSLPRT
jgi:hypothetical protein